jgi:pyruvate kinase
LRKTTLYRGVYPCGIDKMNDTEWEEVNGKVVSILEDKKIVEEGDLIILTKGMHVNQSGGLIILLMKLTYFCLLIFLLKSNI